MSYWSGFFIGVGVGVAAALVRAFVFHRLRPPENWISWVLRVGLYLVPGAVVAIFATDSFGVGVVLWVGSLIGGAVSVFFPVHVPDSARPRNDAAIAIRSAGRSGDKETVASYLESPDPAVRSFAVTEIVRRDWRECVPDLRRRLEEETDAEIKSRLSAALDRFEPSQAISVDDQQSPDGDNDRKPQS